MRYEGLLRAIEKATARYEAEVQRVLQRFAKTDATTAHDLLASLKPGKRKTKLHWTQKPENRARVKRQLKKATKAKHGTP